VETYRTEEEQVEALKKWWQENGRSILLAIALAMAGGYGWQLWQADQAEKAAAASARYDQMIEMYTASSAAEDPASLQLVAQGLKDDFPDSVYASFAALHLARLAAAEDRLTEAEAELRWVLTKNPKPEIRLVAELRLARVIAAQGRPEEALNIIAGIDAGTYAPAYAELEGDIQRQLGNAEAAIAAYQRALALAAATSAGPSEVLQLKLQALIPVPARELAVLED